MFYAQCLVHGDGLLGTLYTSDQGPFIFNSFKVWNSNPTSLTFLIYGVDKPNHVIGNRSWLGVIFLERALLKLPLT